jgi:hypothetical protein
LILTAESFVYFIEKWFSKFVEMGLLDLNFRSVHKNS